MILYCTSQNKIIKYKSAGENFRREKDEGNWRLPELKKGKIKIFFLSIIDFSLDDDDDVLKSCRPY